MCEQLTSFPFGERYMTSRFILDKFNFNLPASCLLVRLGLVLFFVVVPRAVDGVMVVDKGVVAYGASRGGMGIGWSDVAWMHVEGPLPLAHRGRGGLLVRGEMRRCWSEGRKGKTISRELLSRPRWASAGATVGTWGRRNTHGIRGLGEGRRFGRVLRGRLESLCWTKRDERIRVTESDRKRNCEEGKKGS